MGQEGDVEWTPQPQGWGAPVPTPPFGVSSLGGGQPESLGSQATMGYGNNFS